MVTPVLHERNEDRWHAGAVVHALARHELSERCRVVLWPRKDQLGARQGRGIGESPRTCVEKRNDR